MDSSRIFIRGLPPSITEPDFRKHFGAKYTVTDARLFPQRRIGYIGYQSAEDAAQAVKYFNKTFIRMSKIAVELARPIQEEAPSRANMQNVKERRAEPLTGSNSTSLKRKRPSPEPQAQDPKLGEFLEAMKPPSKTKGLRTEEQASVQADTQVDGQITDEGESDQEYQTVSKKRKTPVEKGPSQHQSVVAPPTESKEPVDDQVTTENNLMDVDGMAPSNDDAKDTSDEAWLRSRTSRLLGLVDEDDEDGASTRREPATVTSATAPVQVAQESTNDKDEETAGLNQAEPAAPTDSLPSSEDETEQKIIASQRLYIRNLSYAVTEDDLRQQFATFGELLEVRCIHFSPSII